MSLREIKDKGSLLTAQLSRSKSRNDSDLVGRTLTAESIVILNLETGFPTVEDARRVIRRLALSTKRDYLMKLKGKHAAPQVTACTGTNAFFERPTYPLIVC